MGLNALYTIFASTGSSRTLSDVVPPVVSASLFSCASSHCTGEQGEKINFRDAAE